MPNKFISSILEYNANENTAHYTHGVFRWYGKLVPQLVDEILSQYTKSGDVVLANFNGSGTIGVEGILKGLDVVGTDINPLALLITKVKTTKIKEFDIDSCLGIIISDIDTIDVSVEEYNSLYQPEKWYSGNTAVNLIKIKKSIIKNCRDNDIKDMLLVSLLSIVRDCSNVDSRSVNHIVLDKNKNNPDVVNKFIVESKKIYKAVTELNVYKEIGKITLHESDARDLSFLSDNSVDFIFSHPPYLNAINYFNIHRLATDLMGIQYESIRGVDLSAKNYNNFLSMMSEVFKEAKRVLKPGKKMAVVIGDVRYKGNILPLGVDFVNLLIQSEFELEDIFIWVLKKKAGMSLTRRGNHIDHNYVIVVKKGEF